MGFAIRIPCASSMRALGIRSSYKGARWMPRQSEAKKDVDSCEKLRGAANRL